MGWDFCEAWKTKKDVVKALISGSPDADQGCIVTLDHAVVGNVLWRVIEIQVSHELHIACDLLRKNGGWGYNGMCESVGPDECSCPLHFLNRVPVENEEWRERVRAYHAERIIQKHKLDILAVDQVWTLKNCTLTKVIITSIKPLLGATPTGKIYRIQPKHLDTLTDECWIKRDAS